MADRLQGKVAIVTGAAHGIGRAIAERYGAEGATVIVADINGAGAEEVATAINEAGGTAVATATDVSKKDEVDRLFDQTLERFGSVDVIVNSAGLINT
ncbi:MAG: SDR family NAD(P)-dependent oxidoreductase [Thermomicrobiales bacterium]